LGNARRRGTAAEPSWRGWSRRHSAPGNACAAHHGRDARTAPVAKLNDAVVKSLADPAVRGQLIEIAQDIFPREQQTPEALGAYQKAEIEKW